MHYVYNVNSVKVRDFANIGSKNFRTAYSRAASLVGVAHRRFTYFQKNFYASLC